ASRAPRCFEWAIGASRLSTGPYRNRSWRLPRGSPRIRFRWSKAGLADALPRAMRLKCKRNVPTAPEVRYLGDLAAQRALAAKGWAFGIASPNSDQRTHLRTQVPYPLGIARSPSPLHRFCGRFFRPDHRRRKFSGYVRKLLRRALPLARLRSGPGERQGDIAWDAVQILNDLGAKPEPSRPKLAFPPRVDLGRFAPQGRRPVIFGHADFATPVAAEVTGKSHELEAAFAFSRRLGAIEKRAPHLLVEMFQQHRFDLTQALLRRQLLGRKGVAPDGFLCDGHEFAE